MQQSSEQPEEQSLEQLEEQPLEQPEEQPTETELIEPRAKTTYNHAHIMSSLSVSAWMKEKREQDAERERYRREGPLPMSPENSLFARKQLWVRCEMCGVILYISHLPQYHHTCKGCGENIPMTPEERVASLLDDCSWRPLDEMFSSADPLEFKDKKTYTERLAESQERTESQDAIRVGTGTMDGIPVALGVMNFEFMGGSMGSVVGEVITRLIEGATLQGIMLILVCASGGARMQEGILSLMQMAKISAALYQHQRTAQLNYISILTTPTTGGVTASFAMLGDVIIAEPKAVIGFAGRRVIEQTLGETLPDDFQTAEYLMDHGLVDLIIPRKFLKAVLAYVMHFNVSGFYRQAGTIYALTADGGSDLGESDLGESDLGESDLGESDLGESDLGESDLGELNFAGVHKQIDALVDEHLSGSASKSSDERKPIQSTGKSFDPDSGSDSTPSSKGYTLYEPDPDVQDSYESDYEHPDAGFDFDLSDPPSPDLSDPVYSDSDLSESEASAEEKEERDAVPSHQSSPVSDHRTHGSKVTSPDTPHDTGSGNGPGFLFESEPESEAPISEPLTKKKGKCDNKSPYPGSPVSNNGGGSPASNNGGYVRR
jgi:acetyl-CoA carboxylase carboxyl transferase subunit beta